ncbi:MAG: SDR family NAD(P)-dependent oxidoreductase [Pseudomonadota bacterium]
MDGKVAIITGAGAGIGRASALRLAREGAHVVASDIRQDLAEETVGLITELGGEATAASTDVTQEPAWKELAERTTRDLGRIDGLFNNAGGGSGKDGAVTDLDLDEFWRTIRVDLFGTLLGCRTIIPIMAEQGGGAIVNISSLRAVMGTKGADAYTASKGGVLSLTRAMAMQWAPKKVRINVMAPGVVLTDRVRALIKDTDPIYTKMLLGPCDAQDVADLVYYLLSDQSKKVTGAVFRLDGGASIH